MSIIVFLNALDRELIFWGSYRPSRLSDLQCALIYYSVERSFASLGEARQARDCLRMENSRSHYSSPPGGVYPIALDQIWLVD